MSKQLNDNAFMLSHLAERGAKIVVIAGKSMGQKGSGKMPSFEDLAGVEIYRLYKDLNEMFLFPNKALDKVIDLAKNLDPDVILCSQELNMRLALSIQRVIKKPIVLLVEDAGRIFSGEAYTSLKMKGLFRLFGIPSSGKGFWSWLCEKSAVLITCHPRDQENLKSLSIYGKPVFFLPWPSFAPKIEKPTIKEKDKAIYVGSLSALKNSQEFEWVLPLILEKTRTKQFIVIGPGSHASLIFRLKEKYGDAICYFDHMSRVEAMELISKCYYAFTPIKMGGWGFIGDCWSMATPIVMLHNDSYVVNNENALVSEGRDGLVKNIDRLYDDVDLYKKLQFAGLKEYEKRKSSVVGDHLFNILNGVNYKS